MLKNIFIILSFILLINKLSFSNNLEVHFLDVGFGESILILFPLGKVMLIDTGSKETTYKVVEYIKNKNISKIDYLVLTHPHKENIAGAVEILNKFEITNIYDSGQEYELTFYEDIKNIVKEKKNINYQIVGSTSKITDISEAEISFLNPDNTFITGSISDIDENSVVVYLKYKNTTFLFTGGIGLKAGKKIISKINSPLKIDVLKVSNFGAKQSNNKEFLKSLNIQYAVISVSRRNRYNYPSNETLVILKELSKEIFRTDLNGDIVSYSDGTTIQMKTIKSNLVFFQRARRKAPQLSKRKLRNIN